MATRERFGVNRAVGPKDVDETAPVPEQKNVHQEISDAASVFMTYLPDDIREDINEASKSLQLPLWQLILGYAVRCWDGKLTYSPFLLSSWESNSKPSSTRVCATCGESFYSRFPDAMYCCTPCHFGKLKEFGHTETCPTKGR